MKNLVMILAGLVASNAAFADAIVGKDYVLLTGAHAKEVRALLSSVSERTRKFILATGPVKVEGKNVRLMGKNLGEISGLNDPKLNQLGSAFGVDARGTVFIRGVVPAHLIDRDLRNFDCRNVNNSGSIGFPGSVTSACELL